MTARFRMSRRMKGVLAGVAFLFSVGAVSTKLLGSRYTDFCFCSPPLAQPAFTAPDDRHADAALRGGALPGRVVAERAPLQVEVINAPAMTGGSSFGAFGSHDRDLAHLGVLWGTNDHMSRGTSYGGGSFMGGGGPGGAGGMMMGSGHGRSSTTADNSGHGKNPASSRTSSPSPSRPSAPSAPGAGAILPPSDTSGSTFGSNADPVPGFGTGSTGSTGGPTGVILGGDPWPSPISGHPPSAGPFSVTPEPGTMFLTVTGLLAAFGASRRRRKA